jgi:hypothetical protein
MATPVTLVNSAGVEVANASGGVVVGGSVASGAADSGNPVKIAGVFNSTLPTLDDGDRGDVQLNNRGAMQVALTSAGTGISGSATNADAVAVATTATSLRNVSFPTVYNGTTWDRLRGNTTGLVVISPTGWVYAAATGGIVNSTTAVTIKAAAGAGVRNYLQSIQIDNDALGAATELAIRDGAGGTVLWRGKLGTGAQYGRSVIFDPPLYSTAATLLEVVTLTASVTGGVFVNAQGYTGP